MKTASIFSSALVASVLFASSAAMAAPQHNVNLPKLEMRIDAGVKSGKLTNVEERQLRTELLQLGKSIKAAMKNSQVSKWEYNSLENKETALSRHITSLANNKAVVKKH